jgi:hypothetical protein
MTPVASNAAAATPAAEPFRFDLPATFWLNVPLSTPGHQPDQVLPIEFKYRTREELESLPGEIEGKTDAQVLALLIHDWRASGRPFTPENLQLLVSRFHSAPREIFDAYRDAHWGSQARAKN